MNDLQYRFCNGTKRMIFNIDSAMKHSYSNDDACFSIDVIDEILEEDFDALLDEGIKMLHSIEGTPLEEEIFAEFDEFMAMTADENFDPESDTEEPPFEKITLFKEKKNKLISVLKKHKQAFGWKTTDIPGICPSFCKHKIQLLDNKKPVVQKQIRLNTNIQVVKKEIVKLLGTGIIYPITVSPWVSHIHCVPKKGGITVVTNENDELVPTRTITGWRICIGYRKRNEATAKDHLPLPFMDQMLERLAGNKYFCFLDALLEYFQISIDPNDQGKTIFTCPFGTYAYRRMPFGLCNAPTTFKRRFIKDFSKIARPLTKLFEKDTTFEFDDECQKAFELLKEKLTCDPVIVRPNWNLPFELMRDASDFAVGVVLGEKDDFANYLVGNVITKGMTYQQKNNFFSELKHYFWKEPYLFKVCSDGLIRRCISGPETQTILDQCHQIPTGGDYRPNITAKKVLDSGFYWLTIIKEAHTLVRLCEACQKKAQALPTNDARVVITFLERLFCRFGMPKALTSDRGTNFCNKIMERTMKRYRVNHRFSTSYHPQTSGQVKNTNRALKRILEKTVKDNPAIWSRKLDDALWAFRTTYKSPTGTTSYKLIYGKNCHLPFEIEHRAYWALKNCNPDLIAASEKRMFQLHELDEFRHQAYENSRLYKARTKYPSGYVELYGKDGKTFIINGHQLKLYHEEDNDPKEAVTPFFQKE
nr:reverse transcriptase domain-containing protein [Tanacetum cinerariifolium]